MKNRIEKAAQDYKTQYYGKHSNEGAFYVSDFYEVKEAAEKSGGGSSNPLRSNRDSARSGLYDRVQEGAAGLQEEAPEDNLTEAQAAIMCFELWQDMLINGTAPNPKRYEAEVLDFYKGILAGTHAPFYFMFMGFLGGLDFADMAEKAQEGAAE